MSYGKVNKSTGDKIPYFGSVDISLIGNLNTLTTTDKSNLVNAINEVNSNKQNKTDNSLTTSSKGIVGAINEINNVISSKQNVTDNSLTTSSKTIVGAINELKTGLSKISVVYQQRFNFQSTPDGGTEEFDINIPENIGIGLVVVDVAICNASSITATGANIAVYGLPMSISRESYGIAIPLAKIWDHSVTMTAPVINIGAGTRTVTITNNTGITLESRYNNSIQITYIRLA